MKTLNYLLFCMLFVISSCGQKSSEKDIEDAEFPATDPLISNAGVDQTAKKNKLSKKEQCFVANVKKDSAFLSIQRNGDKVNGRLIYQFAEKDNSKGTFDGTISNDTLTLNYRYDAEGTTSERPLEMVYEGGKLYEIYDHQKPEKGGFVFTPSDCKF